MTANVTDNGGTWNAWTSTSTNNSASPSSGDIDLGSVSPRSNNTIDVLVRLEHQGVWTSSCRAELRVYDFFSDAVAAPNIAYSGSPFTFTKDNTITTITPSNTGGAATSWSITSGSLPSGLSMSSSTGALTGTPTSITSAASITIQASNSGGSDSTTISITVEEEAPNIAYSGSPFTFTKDNTISTITPSNTGGASTSWSITSGSLPSGLSMSSSTGALTGTPTVVSSATSITIQASNSGGSDSTTISITVQDDAPNIAYSGSPFTFTKDNTISTITPSNTGGASTSWSITSGSLPAGLSLSSTTGAISGTPTAVYSTASITIQASNSGGSDSATLSITVNDEAPNIAYGGPYTFTKNTAISTITPSNTGGTATSWSITSGSLPSGLSISSSTGAITGTPTVVYSTASITIQASNSGGSDSTTISVTVEDEAPNIAYGGPYTFTKNTAISTITPTNTGGATTSWSITSGSLPTGLSFSTSTGAITGTPTAVYSTSSITIQASNSGGSDSASISITVQDEAPNIGYGGPYTFTKNTAISTITPTNTGGASSSWSITSGSLPSGLSLSSTTGAISGTPTAVYSTSTITIQASNSGGSDSTTISITVNDEAPNISYGGPYTFTKNTAISTITPTNTGGAATSWSITSGSLPAGLSLSSTTGAISGTPTGVYSTASITIEASNGAGSDSAGITLTVQEQAPNIGYGGPYTFTKNMAISTITPTNTGGASTSWSITSGSLPAGLSLSSTTGAITGTPTAVYSTASITIQASNSGGSDSTSISITVQDEAPNIGYGGPYTFTKNTAISTITPTNTGGAATSWSITSGSLPAGLSLSSATGTISGTPTGVYSTASITIEASNAAGSNSATLSITVNDEAPNIGYGGPYTFTKNTAISTITPTNTGGAATSWSITSGSLPAGLSLSSATGTISGTPTGVYSTASITIEASNAAGSNSATLSITVNDEAPNIAYGGPYTFTKNTAISTITPSNTGGAATSWDITSGTLPAGLSLSSTTGAISGTPTGVYSTASITIEASNAAGSDSATLSITVNDEAPNIGYGGPYTFTKNTAISTITPTNTGGAATSWSITSGSLPSGLSMSSSTGAITGTPTVVYSTGPITIEASNAAGSDSATLSITVNDEAPNIAYGGPYTFTKNTAINTITPTNTGGAASSWSITSGSLPAGLLLDEATGSITGVPTSQPSNPRIFVEASNSAGSNTTVVIITIVEEQQDVESGQTDTDGDGVQDSFDMCPQTEQGAQIDDSGCKIVKTTTNTGDDGSNYALYLFPPIGFLLLLVLLFLRSREDLEEEALPNSKEFDALISIIQTQEMILSVSSQPMYNVNVNYRSFVDECVLVFSNLNNKKDIMALNLICQKMKTDVYVPMGAAAYLRGLTTQMTYILRRHLMEHGWTKAPIKPPTMKYDYGGEGILWRIHKQQRQPWFKQLPHWMKTTVDLHIIKGQAKIIQYWSELLHPESWENVDVNAMTESKLIRDLHETLRFIKMVEGLDKKSVELEHLPPFDEKYSKDA